MTERKIIVTHLKIHVAMVHHAHYANLAYYGIQFTVFGIQLLQIYFDIEKL